MATNQASKGFGAETKWASPVSFQRKGNKAQTAALTIGEFLKQSCDQMSIGVGPRSHEDCPHRVTTECYSADDNASLDEVISASYRQVFGNAHVMDAERSNELEAQLYASRDSCNCSLKKEGIHYLWKIELAGQPLGPQACSWIAGWAG